MRSIRSGRPKSGARLQSGFGVSDVCGAYARADRNPKPDFSLASAYLMDAEHTLGQVPDFSLASAYLMDAEHTLGQVPDFSLASGCLIYRPAAMHGIEIEPLEDEHLAAAAALLADRHARHRTAEALLPEVSDFRAQLERDLDHELASGVVALSGDEP